MQQIISLFKSRCKSWPVKLNGLKETHKQSVEGMVAWNQVDICVMFKPLMRQKDPFFSKSY